MASVHHLFCDATQMVAHVIEKNRNLDTERVNNHYASLLIQRVWRGYYFRREIKKLNVAATILQKYIRRFLVQVNMPNFMLEYLECVTMRHYNKMATRIQALWKGYWFRSRVLDFRKMYAEKQKVAKANEEIRKKIAEYKNNATSEGQQEQENSSREMVLFILFKLHHLIRTQREGIYSDHNSSEYSWIEKLMKSLKFKNYMKSLRKEYNKTYSEPQKRECTLKGRWKECEMAYYLRDKSLDYKPKPIDTSPFIQEKRFCFDPRVVRKYEAMLMSKGPLVPAIKEFVRKSDKALNITEADFDVTMRKVDQKLDVPPYYVDFWSRLCEAHNIEDDK